MMIKPEDDHENWCPWHPTQLASVLSGTGKPWCIVGGWALDLWHGSQTREHEDLEFTILRSDFSIFRKVLERQGLAFYTAGDGIVQYLPPEEEPSLDIAQIWCRDIAQDCWRVDMMIELGTPETWLYKRDPTISRLRGDMVDITSDGVPYLKPAGVLLFKAKHRRDKDEADFQLALPRLDLAERSWLIAAMQKSHPDHEWLHLLRSIAG